MTKDNRESSAAGGDAQHFQEDCYIQRERQAYFCLQQIWDKYRDEKVDTSSEMDN